jgi:hypothetical protein
MMLSIERLRRRLSVASVMPLALLIGSVHNSTDPMRKSGGTGGNGTPTNRYAGVLPVPSSSSVGSQAPSRLDSLLDQHHDARAERGRVLYAAGHAPKPAATPSKNHRRQCSDHVASARGSSNTPNS